MDDFLELLELILGRKIARGEFVRQTANINPSFPKHVVDLFHYYKYTVKQVEVADKLIQLSTLVYRDGKQKCEAASPADIDKIRKSFNESNFGLKKYLNHEDFNMVLKWTENAKLDAEENNQWLARYSYQGAQLACFVDDIKNNLYSRNYVVSNISIVPQEGFFDVMELNGARVSMEISSDCEMYKMIRSRCNRDVDAMRWYFDSGRRLAKSLVDFLVNAGLDPAKLSILEFASGYGRVLFLLLTQMMGLMTISAEMLFLFFRCSRTCRREWGISG